MSKGRNSGTVSIRLDDQVIRLIERRAASKGMTRSQWIARVIQRELGLLRKV